jgi:hypothetical protein
MQSQMQGVEYRSEVAAQSLLTLRCGTIIILEVRYNNKVLIYQHFIRVYYHTKTDCVQLLAGTPGRLIARKGGIND